MRAQGFLSNFWDLNVDLSSLLLIKPTAAAIRWSTGAGGVNVFRREREPEPESLLGVRLLTSSYS